MDKFACHKLRDTGIVNDALLSCFKRICLVVPLGLRVSTTQCGQTSSSAAGVGNMGTSASVVTNSEFNVRTTKVGEILDVLQLILDRALQTPYTPTRIVAASAGQNGVYTTDISVRFELVVLLRMF